MIWDFFTSYSWTTLGCQTFDNILISLVTLSKSDVSFLFAFLLSFLSMSIDKIFIATYLQNQMQWINQYFLSSPGVSG